MWGEKEMLFTLGPILFSFFAFFLWLLRILCIFKALFIIFSFPVVYKKGELHFVIKKKTSNTKNSKWEKYFPTYTWLDINDTPLSSNLQPWKENIANFVCPLKEYLFEVFNSVPKISAFPSISYHSLKKKEKKKRWDCFVWEKEVKKKKNNK